MQATVMSRMVRHLSVVALLSVVHAPHAAGQRVWQWSALPRVSPQLFRLAMERHQGILSRGQLDSASGYIGMRSVSVEPIRNRKTHKPIDGYRRAHTGAVTYVNKRDGGWFDNDDDVNMYIAPYAGSTFAESYIATGRTKATEVEGEIDVASGTWSSLEGRFPDRFALVTGYGPWLHEKHNYFDTTPHDYLEIHPMEQLWRADVLRQQLTYQVGIFSDNSGRFTRWRPNPLVTTTAIAFEHTRGSAPLRFTMRSQTKHNAIPYPGTRDQARMHVLMSGADTIAVVREPTTGEDLFTIDFVSADDRVKTSPGVALLAVGPFDRPRRGFIRIRSAVRDGGHNLWSVTEESRTIARPVDVEVQLVDIVCESVDDDDDTEDLYGNYGVSAAVGGQPFHANAYGDETSSALWSVSREAAVQLRRGDRRAINRTLRFRLQATGEVTVHGDIDERDTGVGGGGDNDRLGPRQERTFPVRDLVINQGVTVTDVHRSGGSRIRVTYVVTRRS